MGVLISLPEYHVHLQEFSLFGPGHILLYLLSKPQLTAEDHIIEAPFINESTDGGCGLHNHHHKHKHNAFK